MDDWSARMPVQLLKRLDRGVEIVASRLGGSLIPPLFNAAALSTVMLLLTVGSALGQDNRVAVGGTIGASTQPVGTFRLPYLSAGPSGTTWGSVFFVDVAITPTITVGGEVSLASDLTGIQGERAGNGSNDWTTSHHDTLFS